ELILMECPFFPFCATMSTLDVTVAYMAERGFIPYEFVDFMRRPLDGAMGQCDILFIKKGHRLVQDLRWAGERRHTPIPCQCMRPPLRTRRKDQRRAPAHGNQQSGGSVRPTDYRRRTPHQRPIGNPSCY